MTLASVTLTNFRTYVKQHIDFSPTITLVIGPNTSGKTNLIESICCLSTGKSFRAEKETDMIRWGCEVAHIQGYIQNRLQDETTLNLFLTHGFVQGQKSQTKKFTVNTISRRWIDFIGNLRSTLFWPTDLELVTDSPSLRRHYLDSVLAQTDREYRRNLISYERGLRQRNMVLERIHDGFASRNQLIFWDQLLIKTGMYLTKSRAEYIESINATDIPNLSYRIVYDKSVISGERLSAYAQEEVAAKATLVGPQRDDFHFEKPDGQEHHMDVSRFGSRGEQRLAVLWLKLAELLFIEYKTEVRPILLLDDIFSELDSQGRCLVLDVIGRYQTIITCAEESITSLFSHKSSVSILRLPIS